MTATATESRQRKDWLTMDFWSFFWLLVWSFFFVAYLIMLFHIFGDLFRDKELGGFAKVLWVLVLFIFPLLSALIYLIVRGRGMAEREMEAAQAQMAAQEKYIRSVAGGSTASTTDQLSQAKSLLDSGAISPEEFSQIKARALA